MSSARPSAPEAADDEVATLIARLHETEHRLEELTAGEVDAVLDSDGRMFLLRRAQDRLRHTEAAKQAAILNALPAHIALLDNAGVIVSVNEAWERFDKACVLHGPGSPIGLDYLAVCDGAQGVCAAQSAAIASGVRSVLSGAAGGFSIEYACRTPVKVRWFLLTVTPLSNEQRLGAVVMHADITEERRVKDALSELARQVTHSAEHDFLTGLPNRLLFTDRIGQSIAMARRHSKRLAILFLDLDGFKEINDSLGHATGDELLKSTAKRLVGCVRASDTVSRQGGDEFVVLLAEVQHAEDAAISARRMLHAMSHPHHVDRHELHVSMSIGVSVYPDDGTDAETLIKHADTAMYQEKKSGRHGYRFFQPAMNARAVERQFIEEGLRRALERKELALHYRAKIDLISGAITGAQALLSWVHPTRGPIAPANFIGVAENCGLIVPIRSWVLREACAQFKAWTNASLPLTTLSISVSGTELRDSRFVDEMFAVLEDTGLQPNQLELQLSESVLMTRMDSTSTVLQGLRARGMRVVVDEFGTGHSSLRRLQHFPVDAIKIDQSFIHQITSAPGSVSVAAAAISMGRSLQLRVIADGVQTAEELALLRALHCDEAQGEYFGPRLLGHQFAELLRGAL